MEMVAAVIKEESISAVEALLGYKAAEDVKKALLGMESDPNDAQKLFEFGFAKGVAWAADRISKRAAGASGAENIVKEAAAQSIDEFTEDGEPEENGKHLVTEIFRGDRYYYYREDVRKTDMQFSHVIGKNDDGEVLVIKFKNGIIVGVSRQ